MTAFEQVLRIKSNEYDGDDAGNEWQVQYVLFRTEDADGTECFDLYTDDGKGNGEMICRGYSQGSMVSLALRLGEFVEWRASVFFAAAAKV